jgi:hypothetical protein
VGVVLYRLLTGRVPFDGDTVVEVYARILNAPARSMRDLRPDLGWDLDAIVLKCLDKDPNRRFQTAGELSDALRDHREGYRRLHETPSSMAPPVFVDDTPIEIPGVHSRWPALLAFAAVALGGALLYEVDHSGRVDVRELGKSAAASIEGTAAYRATRDAAMDTANAVTRAVNRARGVPELQPTSDSPVRVPERPFVVSARGIVSANPAFDSSGVTLAAIPELHKEDPEESSHPVFILDSKPVLPVPVPPNALPFGDASALDDE